MDPLTILGIVFIIGTFLAYKHRARLPQVDLATVAAVVAIVGLLVWSNRERLGLVQALPSAVSQVDVVESITAKISGDDAEDFGNYCLAMADLIEADQSGEYAKTIEDLRQIHILAGKGSLKSRLKKSDGVTPKYPGFADAFDAAVFGAVGKHDTFLSADQRAKLVKLLRDLHAALT